MDEYKLYLENKIDNVYASYKLGKVSQEEFEESFENYKNDKRDEELHEANVEEFLKETDEDSEFFDLKEQEETDNDLIAQKSKVLGTSATLNIATTFAYGFLSQQKIKSKEEDETENEGQVAETCMEK